MTVGTTPRGEDDATSAQPEDEASATSADEGTSAGMGLLTEGVPLALLADLADPDGPASPVILEDEGLPEVAWWDDADREGDSGAHEADDSVDDAGR